MIDCCIKAVMHKPSFDVSCMFDACQTRLIVITGDATQFYTEFVDGPLTMAYRLHTCSRDGCAFSPGSHRPRGFQVWAFVFDQADGNARVDTAEVAWRTAEAELDVGKNPGVLVLTIHCAFTLLSWSLVSCFLVGYGPAWTLAFGRRRRGTQVLLFRPKVAESLQAHHAVHVNWLRLPLPLRLLCFGILWVCGTWRSFTASTVGPTFLEVMIESLCLGGYGGRLWPRVSTRRASSPCLSCSSRASFSFAGSRAN